MLREVLRLINQFLIKHYCLYRLDRCLTKYLSYINKHQCLTKRLIYFCKPIVYGLRPIGCLKGDPPITVAAFIDEQGLAGRRVVLVDGYRSDWTLQRQ
jgi:hypothetical protein